MAALKTKTISSLIWKLLERGGNGLIALLVQIVMARLLAPEDFGSLAILIVFINVSNVFVQSGFNTALMQSSEVDEVDCSTVFWICLTVAIVLYAVIFSLAPLIGLFYDNESLAEPLRGLALVLFPNAFNAVQVAIITRELELRKVFIAAVVAAILSGATGIAMALSNLGLWALVGQQVAYQVVNCAILFALSGWRPKFVFSVGRARELFGFGWKLLVSGVLNTAYQSLSSLIIGKQFSKAELGMVSQGEKYPQAICGMLDGAIQPIMLAVTAQVQNSIDTVREVTRRALKTSSFLIFPAMGMLALIAEPLVLVLLGEKWLSAVPFFQMYCFIYALYPIQSANLQALNGIGRSDIFLKLEIIKKSYGVLILCFTAFALQSVYAIVGGLMVSNALSMFVNSAPTKRTIGYGYGRQLRDIAPGFLLTIAAMVIALPITWASMPPVVCIVIQCATMAVVYVGLASFFKVEEFSFLVSTTKEYCSALLKR